MSTHNIPARKARGLSLFSGGLDSILAILVLREQGCLVEAVTFSSPFFHTETTKTSAEKLGVKLHVIDFTDDIISLLDHPRHGYGKAMNPCIDCHALMIRRAGELMSRLRYDFVATGEVLNQRPMSQNRNSLEIVAKTSELSGRLIRPLSAQLLEETIPEKEGLIDRSKLCAIEGRGRHGQKELAAHFNLTEYPSPAGGCLLTEKMFCEKLHDLKAHKLLSSRTEVELLRLGRHFRLPGGAKLIVGRDAAENLKLQHEAARSHVLIHPVRIPGPTSILSCDASDEDFALAVKICAGYTDKSPDGTIVMRILSAGEKTDYKVVPLARQDARVWLI